MPHHYISWTTQTATGTATGGTVFTGPAPRSLSALRDEQGKIAADLERTGTAIMPGAGIIIICVIDLPEET